MSTVLSPWALQLRALQRHLDSMGSSASGRQEFALANRCWTLEFYVKQELYREKGTAAQQAHLDKQDRIAAKAADRLAKYEEVKQAGLARQQELVAEAEFQEVYGQ